MTIQGQDTNGANDGTTADRAPVTIIVTGDRYDLQWESSVLDALPDFAVTLRMAPIGSEAELIELASDADALLVSSREAVTRRALEHMPKLRVIGRYAVGLDNLDLDAATDHNVVVTHPPYYCTNEVADHAFALLLAMNRRVHELDRDLRAGAWNRHQHLTRQILRGPVPALREQTLGIVGFGRIGGAVAKRAHPFGLTVLAADPYVDPDQIRAAGAEPTTLDDLLARSDIVTIHCPLTPETRGLIDARALGLMKPTAVIVNTARGPIIDLDALVAALESGRLAGAALDVVYPEPIPLDHPLYQAPNVMVTPHAAYYSERSVDVLREETLKSALAVLRGRRPPTVANPAVLRRVQLADGE